MVHGACAAALLVAALAGAMGRPAEIRVGMQNWFVFSIVL
jgi:hypothetical protein